jgi:cysteine desulfurase / selenocysteine lyase
MKQYKQDFPILTTTMFGSKPLIYLDSSNSTQKPQCVIDAIAQFYQNDYANIHRGVYHLSEHATQLFEGVRKKIKEHIHAKHPHEIIFTSGTTAGINLAAHSLGHSFAAGDEVILSVMEHHSNIVPWQMLQEKKGIQLKIIPMSDQGELDLVEYEKLLSTRTKMVSIIHVSNVLGTINPIKKMIAMAHARGVPVLVDGAQAFPHLSVDMQALDCDFYVFSSHKAYGPTGVGALYGKTEWLEKMPPYQGGGDMIEQVTFEKTTYAPLPAKFEAGTPNIADVIGFGAALDYLQKIGMPHIQQHEQLLLKEATKKLSAVPGVHILGTADPKAAVLTFVIDDIHAHDVGTILDREGIAVRVGHHCAMPLMQRLNVPATIRASFGLYNTKEDIDALVNGLHVVTTLLSSRGRS